MSGNARCRITQIGAIQLANVSLDASDMNQDREITAVVSQAGL
jgi:hypothetical protein